MATLQESLTYQPVELAFGTSGLRGLVTDMTDLECYINTAGFLRFLQQNSNLAPNATVYLAGDLRASTPRILRAVHKAIGDAGYKTVYSGLIPTPAIAYYALQQNAPSIMVTGSHIPDDRNGIKFYKPTGEVLKSDEIAIKDAVAAVRAELYGRDIDDTGFTVTGALGGAKELPEEDGAAREAYVARYTTVFGKSALEGLKVIFYQHSAVGRDILVSLLRSLGAEIVPVGRSAAFVPIDTENVTPADQAYFAQLAKEHAGSFAILSTDGDSDRPFVIDENGHFHRGDVLGAVVADWLKADFAAFPISSSDAVDSHLASENVPYVHTKIGSPYVIVAMQEAIAQGKQRVVGWEVNGGFMLGDSLEVNGGMLAALPTRDAILPIIIALIAAKQEGNVSRMFAKLEARFTQAGLIDNFPVESSQTIVSRFNADTPEVRAELGRYFTSAEGFGAITAINTLDGVRISFDNGDIAHIRPSGNAPQLRIYSVANTQERADHIVARAIAEPDGIFRAIEQSLR